MVQSANVPPSRRRTAHGKQTHQTILRTAVDVASVEGLEGLSIGRLATELGMSKSGLFAHFGSKEELQLAAIDTAIEIYAAEVVQPAMAVEPGITRLQALMDAWLSYGERKVFRGGCFFASIAMEFDSRPGMVRDRLSALMQQWLTRLKDIIQDAKDREEIDPSVDPDQLAFELHITMWGANSMYQLYDTEQVRNRIKQAIAAQLERVIINHKLSFN